MVKVVYPSILCDDTVRKLSAIGIEKMSDYVNEIEAAPDAVKLLFKDKLEMIILGKHRPAGPLVALHRRPCDG